MNKASGGGRITTEIFQILKDDAAKVLYSICQQIRKTQQWPQDWKRLVFILIPRKAMPKNAQNTAQFHSSHTLTNTQNSPSQASTVRELRTSRCSSWIQKRQRSKRSNGQHLMDHKKTRVFQKKLYFCFIDYTKAFACVDHN